MTRADLISRMHRAGLRLDDSALAADVALNMLRRERDALIVRAVTAGLSVRCVASIVGLTHPRVIQVVNRSAGRLPPAPETMQTPEKGRASPCQPSPASEPGSN